MDCHYQPYRRLLSKTGAILGLAAALFIPAQAICEPDAPTVEVSPIPRDKRPNFSAMLFMVGTWNCSVDSSRRPRPFSARSVTSISPDGYWMLTTTTTPAVPWNPISIVAHDSVTFDPTRSIWIDMTMDNYGIYGVSTSKGEVNGALIWEDQMFPTSHSTAVHLPRMVQQTDERTMVSTQRFREPSGQTFRVITTCKKA